MRQFQFHLRLFLPACVDNTFVGIFVFAVAFVAIIIRLDHQKGVVQTLIGGLIARSKRQDHGLIMRQAILKGFVAHSQQIRHGVAPLRRFLIFFDRAVFQLVFLRL